MTMSTKPARFFATLFGICLAGVYPLASWAACEVRSGAGTAALVELYTSEGCSSCPPADRQLGRIDEILGTDAAVVPLALHVDYWDDLGWRDSFAQPAFSQRQSRLVESSGKRTVYTPQFFINGGEAGPSLAQARAQVQALNAAPATAHLHISGKPREAQVLELKLEADAAGDEPASMYVALAENGVSSAVSRGENSGMTLTHAHVVRAWLGPLALDHGVLNLQRDVPLAPSWDPAMLEVIAFIENPATGRIVQSIRALQCAKS